MEHIKIVPIELGGTRKGIYIHIYLERSSGSSRPPTAQDMPKRKMRSNSSVASPESWLRSAVSSIPEISRIAAFGSHESWGIGHERTKIGQVWFQVNEGGTCLANAKVGGRGREDNIVLWATSKTVLAEQVIGRINQSVKSGK